MSVIAYGELDERNFKRSYWCDENHKAVGTFFKITNVLWHCLSLKPFDERFDISTQSLNFFKFSTMSWHRWEFEKGSGQMQSHENAMTWLSGERRHEQRRVHKNASDCLEGTGSTCWMQTWTRSRLNAACEQVRNHQRAAAVFIFLFLWQLKWCFFGFFLRFQIH